MSGHRKDSARAASGGSAATLLRRPPHAYLPVALAMVAIAFLFSQVLSRSAGAGIAASNVTIDARDFTSGAQLEHFNFIVNVDNTKKPSDPLALSTESNSPIVAEGNQDNAQVTLPNGRYLVSVRGTGHKMWGAYFTLPNDAGTLRVDLTETDEDHPLPLAKIRVFVFNDNAWTNGAPDTEEAGLGGFQVELKEQTDNAVTVDYNNDPLCGGICRTSNTPATRGFVEINNLGPATYFIDVHPPAGPCNGNPDSQWYQTTTIDGGLSLWAPSEEGADGTGAPGEQLWEPPDIRTAYWFGFVCAPRPFANFGSGEIVGTARNWVEWAPYTVGTFTDPVENPLVALSDASTDVAVYVGRGDEAGNFDIQGVPAGDYNLAIWDEQLSYIMRFKPVHVNPNQTVDVNELGDDGSVGIGVSRWFGWLDGTVYKDVNGNGRYDGPDTPIANTDVDQRWRDGSIKETTVTDPTGYYVYPTAEGGALGRWIINEQGFSRFSSYPGASVHDERGDAVNPSCWASTPMPGCVPNALGGGLLMNQLLLEGHRATTDWGKVDYPAGTPGQIVGVTYFATTRNEFDARFQAEEDYEPAIPDVTVYLEDQDGLVLNKYVTDKWEQPSASQDPIDDNGFSQNCNPIKDYSGGDITSQFSPRIGPNCLEVPLDGLQTKEGAFDGGYAFATYCPEGYDLDADDGSCLGANSEQQPLVAGTYVTHMVSPEDPNDNRKCNPPAPASGFGLKRVSGPFGDEPESQTGCLYHPVREEDVNVDLGNQFAPQIPPPPCAGDEHLVDQSTVVQRSPYFGNAGAHAPLCDKRLVVLQNGQNANADFFLMTNFNTDPNGSDSNDARIGDVEEPGRIVGQVFNDIYFERNKQSPWYGEPRPIANIPIGVYARVDSCRELNNAGKCTGGYSITGHEVGRDGVGAPEVTYDANKWRLIKTIKTSADGAYEILLPSTETFNCPIPQGPCPGMYLLKVNDPGFIDGDGHPGDHSNSGYNPNILTATSTADVWPGLTTQMDTPLDPISGTACEDPAGGTNPDPSDPARPDLLQVDRPYVLSTDTTAASRRITIKSDFIGSSGPTGATGGRVTLTDWRTGTAVTLTRPSSQPPSLSSGGIVSWTPGSGSTPDTIVVQIPALGSGFFPGPKQLTITTANGNGAVSSVNGLTVHVLGTTNNVTYNPEVVDVGAPTPNGHQLQNAIDDTANNPNGSLLVLRAGTYNENVLLWRPMKIQGLGPGGIIGAHELQARDPEDPRFNIEGSVVDGRFYDAGDFFGPGGPVASHDPYYLPNFTNGSPSSVLGGADITVVAKTSSSYDLTGSGNQQIFSQARIDGLGLMTGQGQGAGGIQLQAGINNMQITNNLLENNGGVVAGGIALGQPFVASHNQDVRLDHNRLIGNGALTQAGGIGIFNGSNRYEVANSVLCSNFSVNYGAGIGHLGSSPNGTIKDNQIYYNESVDSGGGVTIAGELPVGGGLGDGSGAVDIDRNLIQSNTSVMDDGGGLFVLNALGARINVRNNMIVNNVAADLGGAILLDDSSRVAIVNNTIANNATTASTENSALDTPHAAGLVSEANEPLWQTNPTYTSQYPTAATRPYFSNPIALFNNIFWQNDAMTLSQFGPGATLVDQGFIDFEVFGTCAESYTPPRPANACATDTFTPRYSDLTNGQILRANGVLNDVPPNQFNITADPLFATPFVNELTVAGSRLDPQAAAVSITGADPPVGLTGDYHIAGGSPAANNGAGFSNYGPGGAQNPNASSVFAPCSGTAQPGLPADFDQQWRPRRPNQSNTATPWERGADELQAGSAILIPSSPGFNWSVNCSTTTVPTTP
jgi:large repetitive protein